MSYSWASGKGKSSSIVIRTALSLRFSDFWIVYEIS